MACRTVAAADEAEAVVNAEIDEGGLRLTYVPAEAAAKQGWDFEEVEQSWEIESVDRTGDFT